MLVNTCEDSEQGWRVTGQTQAPGDASGRWKKLEGGIPVSTSSEFSRTIPGPQRAGNRCLFRENEELLQCLVGSLKTLLNPRSWGAQNPN